jgi:hypothetical protein
MPNTLFTPTRRIEVPKMYEQKSINKRPLVLLLSPVVLIRLGSTLFVGLMIGHMSAYPWTSTHALQETQLVGLMKTVAFEFLGEPSSYWHLYFGWGLLVGVLLLSVAVTLWLLSDIAHIAPRSVGFISGIISWTSLVGAYISFRFFYRPPFLFYSVLCAILAAAAVQLLKIAEQPVKG